MTDCCADDGDCVSTDPCVAGRCDAGTQKCVFEGSSAVCWLGEGCVVPGEAHPDEACKVCDLKTDGAAFVQVESETVCDDDNVCTENDHCNDHGQCLGALVPDCCTADVYCNTTEPCTVAFCDPETHTCAVKPAEACCDEGVCCDTNNGAVKTAGKPCGTEAVSTAYQCNGNEIEQRTANLGCDGVTADVCSAESEHWVWSTWVTIDACLNGTECVFTNAQTMPTCAGLPPGKDCQTTQDCEDGLPCSKPNCVAGQCANTPLPKGLQCGQVPVDTIYQCGAGQNADVMVQLQYAACDGAALSCMGNEQYWTPWELYLSCGPNETCKVTDSSKAGTCEASGPTGQCEPAQPCCDNDGTYSAVGTACPNILVGAKYQCTLPALGGAVQKKQGYAGCTGSSAMCSSVSFYVVYDEWETIEQCSPSQSCKEGFSTTSPGTCESDCTPGGTCCDNNGLYAPEATQCGTTTVDTEYKCDNTGTKSTVLARDAYQGCKGYVDQCSTYSIHYAWTDWAVTETCSSFEICTQAWSGAVPTCELAGDCQPGSECCSATGTYEAQKAKCGSSVVKTEFKCSTTSSKGGKVEVREAHAGCNGSGICSELSYYLSWGNWSTHQVCPSNAKCDPDVSKFKPGTCETDCDAGTECCTAIGDYADKGTKCGTSPYDTEYKCTTEATKGGTVLSRLGWKGCSGGTSTYCSSSTLNLFWEEWKVKKNCKVSEFCEEGYLTTSEAKCVTECSPNSTCCSSLGEYEPKGTQCTTYVQDEKYKCSTLSAGGAILAQEAYKGCDGDGYCSLISDNLYWTGQWDVHKQCKSNEVCQPDSWGEGYAGKCVAL